MTKYTFLGKVENCEYYFENDAYRFERPSIKKRVSSEKYEAIVTREFLNLPKEELIVGVTIFLSEINKNVEIKDIVKDIDGGLRIYTDYVIEEKLNYKSLDKAVNKLDNYYYKKYRCLIEENDELRRSYKKLKFFNLYKKLK
ncbi:hypothetical protein NSQ93_22905 [Bacillus sp. FSL W8-0445]|uniref:hypothetical protein n=1 Tax=Bacillota TaxID=1239 RepID=UPI000778EFF8|nr:MULTISPECIES: hypothetical protein [Bacillota]KYC73927.1 hypothetical protein B4092_4962 [Bacillus licheniformis]MDE1406948.1 hypothetical protein [Bacillus licheniformis]NFT30708.1 hypothetical protein [Clostridium sporogenes]OJT57269.1 hypothetical protein BFP47_11165 [Bacillus licheniformis]OJT70089.1 hypothetical protein BFP46_05725 [Bacillus licheniformis]